MAGPLKEIFDAAMVDWLAAKIASVAPDFAVADFAAAVKRDLKSLELKARIERIAFALRDYLPPDFPTGLGWLRQALGEPPPPGDGTDFGDFRIMACHRYISLCGLDRPRLAVPALFDLTRHVSAEFDIRHFLAQDLPGTLVQIRRWIKSPDWRQRRLACEGARPLLPWGLRLQALIRDPAPSWPILEALRDDPILAVRRSVANHLGDIAKNHPDLVVARLRDWQDDRQPHRAILIRHALRHLVKQGHAGALALIGVDHGAKIALDSFAITPKRPAIGESLVLAAILRNTGRKAQRVILDYAIHHRQARGGFGIKVFKGTEIALAPGASIEFSRRHSLKPVTTRRYYPGRHTIDIRANGRVLGAADFHLRAEKKG